MNERLTLALLLTACAPAAPPPVTARVRLPAAQPTARVRAAPPPDPCSVVRANNDRVLGDASRRASELVLERGIDLKSALEQARKDLRDEGSKTITIGSRPVRFDALSEDQLRVLMINPSDNWEVAGYARSADKLKTFEAVYESLRDGTALPVVDGEPLELCEADDHGAWGFWIEHASYVPSDGMAEWRVAVDMRVARVSKDGSVVKAAAFPQFFDPVGGDAAFLGKQESNCCYSGYRVGEPRVTLLHDQDGDGVRELGLTAEYGVEGSYDLASVAYRFSAGKLLEYEAPYNEAKDFDGDGRMDLVQHEVVEVGESCDSGFPVNYWSPSYLAHALPDGTYSNVDSVAESYTRQQCVERGPDIDGPTEIWCAKVFSVDDATILASVRAHCSKDVCSTSDSPCAWLEAAARSFDPPLRLKAP